MNRGKKAMDPVAYLGPDERWRLLGAAVVKQAILDWKEATLKLSKPETANKDTLEKKRSAEHFISSYVCELYSGCDGKTLLRKLKEGII